MSQQLTHLEPGRSLVYGGDRVTVVPPELAAAFAAGDRLVVVQETGDLLHVPQAEHAARRRGGRRGRRRRSPRSAACTDEQIIDVLRAVRRRGSTTTPCSPPSLAANAPTSRRPAAKGRSTTRLVLSPAMRADMVGRPAQLARHRRSGASSCCRRSTTRLVGVVVASPARRRRLRVRGPPERVRRRHRRAAHRQHGRVPHRQRRARNGAGDHASAASRPALAAAGLPGGRGAADRLAGARRRLGAVRRRAARPRRRPRLGRGGRPARRGRPPARRAGQPARHRRSVDRGRPSTPTLAVLRRRRSSTRSTARCATR